MKKLTKFSLLALAPSLVFAFTNSALEMGVNYGYRTTGFNAISELLVEPGDIFSGNATIKQKININQFGISAKYNINDYLGIEGNAFYGSSKTPITIKCKTKQYKPHESLRFIAGNEYLKQTQASVNGNAKATIAGTGLAVIGQINVLEKLKIFTSAGINYTTCNVILLTEWKGKANPLPYKDSKFIPKITAGLDYRITDKIGLKASVSFEQTSRFKGKEEEKNLALVGIHKGRRINAINMKNSMVYGLSAYIAI